VRPAPTKSERRIWRMQEAAVFFLLVGAIFLIARGLISPWVAVQAYATGVAVILMNGVRTLVAHRYQHDREDELTFVEQLLDSCNYPNHPLTSELWAPVGLRFHGLHHLFPSLPYHNLGIAHRRLMAALPADSIYRRTSCESLPKALAELWRSAAASTRQTAATEPQVIRPAPATMRRAAPSRTATTDTVRAESLIETVRTDSPREESPRREGSVRAPASMRR
jgi:fatty acid desaturase